MLGVPSASLLYFRALSPASYCPALIPSAAANLVPLLPREGGSKHGVFGFYIIYRRPCVQARCLGGSMVFTSQLSRVRVSRGRQHPHEPKFLGSFIRDPLIEFAGAPSHPPSRAQWPLSVIAGPELSEPRAPVSLTDSDLPTPRPDLPSHPFQTPPRSAVMTATSLSFDR